LKRVEEGLKELKRVEINSTPFNLLQLPST